MRKLALTLMLAGLFAVGSLGTALAACWDGHVAKGDTTVAGGSSAPSTPIVVPTEEESAGG